MATRPSIRLTTSPVNLITAFNADLVRSSSYAFQMSVKPIGAKVRFYEGSAAPTENLDSLGIFIEGDSVEEREIPSADNLYAWASEDGVYLAAEEVA